jgi:beta-galactosidase
MRMNPIEAGTGPDGRSRFDMDREWRFHFGDILPPYEKGHGHCYATAKAGGARGAAHEGWNDNEWEPVDLPHDWRLNLGFDPETRPSQGYKQRGTGWYRKRFLLNEEWRGKQLLLLFDGVATHSTVYFNGSALKRTWCGYTGFTVDISDMAFYGEKPNTLAVRVDAEEWEGWWYEGAGIYRHVTLIVKPALHIAQWGVWVNPVNVSPADWETRVETTVENGSDEDRAFELLSILLDGDGREVTRAATRHQCGAGRSTTAVQTIPVASPALWDIDAPNLYTLVSRLIADGGEADEERTTYGYRTLRICPVKGFFLNGRSIKLKGTCNHQDHACVGAALPDNLHELRVRRLLEMGSNAYRCAHNPPAPELLDACDRLGMLVMDENRNFDSSPEGVSQVEGMVLRDRNHPSVVMWSLCNEEPLQGSGQGRAIARRLYRAVKRLDPSRPVLSAMNGGLFEEEGMATVADITGINYMLDSLDPFHQKHPDQPIVSSEAVCAFSTRGAYRSDPGRHVFACLDEEHAAFGDTLRATWKAVRVRDFVMGTFVWAGFDYRGEPVPYEWPSVSSFGGVMDACGFAKGAFFLLHALWTEAPTVHVLSSWTGLADGERVRVMTVTNGDEVELSLNGRSLGRRPSDPFAQLHWEVPYMAGTLSAVAYRDGARWAEDSVTTAGAPAALLLERIDPLRHDGRTDAEVVNVCAVDESGRIVPDSDNPVRFTVEGAGRIAGVGNGDPNCHEPDASGRRSLFNGRCQLVIHRRSAGGITVRAESDGLRPATCAIDGVAVSTMPSLPAVHDRFIEKWRMLRKIFSERPDPDTAVAETDMSSWEAIQVGYGPQKMLDGARGYVLYRAEIALTPEEAGKELVVHFHELLGSPEVYINGRKAAEKDCQWGAPLDAPVPAGARDRLSITVILKCSEACPWSGISKTVVVMPAGRPPRPTTILCK